MIKRFFYILNALALAGLLLSCLACYINPSIVWPLSFLGLAFPIVVIVIFLFLLIWAVSRQKMFWVNLIAIALSWPFIRTVVSLHFTTGDEKGIRLMSYNVKNFDLYNWSGNKETRAKMMKLIKEANPDVICFQEYYTDDEQFFNTEFLRDSLGYKYHYVHTTYDRWYKHTEKMKWFHLQWGLAIFSKYDISDTGVVRFDEYSGNQSIYADLTVSGQKLRIYNAHLQSIHLDQNDDDTMEELSENYSASWNKVRNILRKMKHATGKRSRQALALHDHVSKYDGRKIICGDFNDAPVSFTYQTIRSGLQDAFVAKGRGFGKSFSSKLGIFRIDYVLPDPSIQVNSCRTIRKELSDHYPVVVSLSL